jgi:nicotinamidase-related amidase
VDSLRIKSRFYDMVPIGSQKGYTEVELELALQDTAFFLIDVYGLGFSAGEPKPEREPLWFPGSYELEHEIVTRRIVPCLEAARRLGMKVVYTNNSNPLVRADRSEFGDILRRTHGLTDQERWLTESPEEFQYSECVRPRPGEHESKKLVYSGFFGTQLDTLLRNLAVKNLIAVGFATNACLHTTLTEAMYRNYRVILLRDCTAGMECDDTYQEMALTNAFLRFIETHVGFTATSDEFLRSATAIQRAGRGGGNA